MTATGAGMVVELGKREEAVDGIGRVVGSFGDG